MKRLISWLFVSVAGLMLMAFSYYNYQYESFDNPWEHVFMYVGKGDPNSEVEGLKYSQRPVRLLPLADRAQHFTQIAKNFGPDVEKSYRVALREKVIFYSDISDDFTSQMLHWGRLPEAGAVEALAGYAASHRDEITIEGNVFKVTGRLKKGVGVFANSYLIGKGVSVEELFETGQSACILRLSPEQLSDSEIGEQLKAAFPKSQFTMYMPLIRTKPAAFFIYMSGMALFLLGGCLAFLNLYCTLADRIRNKWLQLTLAEIGRYKHLFISLHLIYFGAVLLFMLMAYSLPELQVSLLTGITSQITDGSGPLAIAGKAYASRSILLAAVTTFAINFPLGSLACITLPSIIIPGSGTLIAGLRASLWGLLLAPTFDALSGMMVPHSVTLLLEGHGYVIATFFGVLVLVYLCRKAEGPSAGIRYGRALLMNVRGNLLVIIVLAVAAVYEAIEVILMMLWTGR